MKSLYANSDARREDLNSAARTTEVDNYEGRFLYCFRYQKYIPLLLNDHISDRVFVFFYCLGFENLS